MSGLANCEVRSVLRVGRRVAVTLTQAGAVGQRLKLLVGGSELFKKAGHDGVGMGRRLEEPKSPEPRENENRRRPAHLTRRELQILRFIAEGLHNRQIADRIHRSIKTVEKHRQSLHTKLSTHEVAGLTRYALSAGLMDESRRRHTGLGKGAKQLTQRELEVLKLVAQGSGNKWIASELHRSIKTVDHHRENIMKKLGIHEVAGLTRYAACLGLM